MVILKRHAFAATLVGDGDQVEIVNFVGGGSDAANSLRYTEASRDTEDMTDSLLTIAGRTFRSRLIVGTGKYPSNAGHGAGARSLGRGHGHGGGAARERDRSHRASRCSTTSTPIADVHPAEHGWLLHRR